MDEAPHGVGIEESLGVEVERLRVVAGHGLLGVPAVSLGRNKERGKRTRVRAQKSMSRTNGRGNGEDEKWRPIKNI